jgi:hypothetical protein
MRVCVDTSILTCDALLTRDREIFRKYFQELKSYTPHIPK